MMNRRNVLQVMSGLLAVVLAATAAHPAGLASTDDRYRIVCTTGMVADVVRAVAGDHAEVIGLLGEGVDPHLYKPTRTDIATLMNADIIFYNGLLLEGKMSDSLIRAATAGKKVHAVTELLDEQYLLEPEDFEGHYDPHVWMDPDAWAKTIDVVRERLAAHDATNAAAYTANADAYAAKLRDLSAYADKVLATVPADRRVLITAHDAFNYFGRRFDFEVVGIQGISTDSEAGVRHIESLVNMIVARKIPGVFVESTVADRHVKALIAGAKARGHTVVIAGELFSDAMGKPGTYEGTYIGMIDHNVTMIARGLGGTAPTGGMQGKLSPEHSAP